jgi:hypothetical protein
MEAAVGERNGQTHDARIAAEWGWEAIVRSCPDALPSENRDDRKLFA